MNTLTLAHRRRSCCLLLAAAALLAIGCPAKTTVTATGAKTSKISLAFIPNNAYDFWTIARRGTEKAAAEFNVEVEFRAPPSGSAAEQRQIIEDLVTKGIKGLAISPNDAANQAEFLDDIATKIPVIAQDSDLPPGSKRVCYVGTNNFEAGKSAGELVKRAIPNGGKVMIYVGKLDVQNAVERRNGVVAALAGLATLAEADALVRKGYPIKAGAWEIINTMTDDAQKQKCKANVEDTLVKHPDVKCLVGLWEYNPPAMLAAVREAKKEGQIAIVGFDENDETLNGIKAGHVTGTIVQQPFEFGYQSIRLLHAIVMGEKDKEVPKDGILYVPHKVIDKGNVEAFHAELKQLKEKTD